MASLALGAAGAFVGNLVFPGLGGAVGWALGAAAGNILFAEKPQPARLHDLHLQGSSYGAMLKMFWGKVRLSGNMIWQTDLQEHVSGGKGGKGSQGGTASYTASFDVALCETQVAAVKKIWAGGRLNYDSEQPDPGALPFTFYDGNPTQLPDPTEEAVEGVGNVPAYRGISRVVVKDAEMGLFGNTLPQLSFEVVSTQGYIPWRVSTFDSTLDVSAPYNIQATYDDATGIITVGAYLFASGSAQYVQKRFLIDGTLVDSTPAANLDLLAGLAPTSFNGAVINLQAVYCIHQGAPETPNGGWYVGTALVAPVDAGSGDSAGHPVYQNGYIYATDGTGFMSIRRWVAPGGVPTIVIDATYTLGAVVGTGSGVYCSAGDGYVWVTDDGALGSQNAMWKFDQDLNLIHIWTRDDLPAVWTPAFQKFFYKGMVAINTQNGSDRQLVVYRINDDFSFTLVGNINQEQGPEIQLLNGLVLDTDGVCSLDPPDGSVFLSEVVGALCEKAGLAQYNVSQLTKIRVDGFVIESSTTCRAAIELLMPVYFFDAVESDGVIKFVVRGGPSIVTFEEDDLAAHMDHDGLPALLTCVHTPDADLPASLTIAYINKDADYQVNTQPSEWQVGGSRETRTISVPIVLTDSHAKKIVDSWLYNTWSERDAYTWYTSRKYARYEPTDVCTVMGKVLRITQKLEGATGVIKWEGVPSKGANFTQAGAGGAAKDPTQVITTAQASQLVLLDIPLVEDIDTEGLYVAMAGATRPGYSGGILYESVDGSNYTSLTAVTHRSTIGAATTVLQDFTGVNVFDEASIATVAIGAGGGTLTSATEAEVLNGANMAVWGVEILQFKNAVLTAPSTYEISGFLRGRRGTEWATNTHVIGDRFVLLPVTNVAVPISDLGRARSFKAVTFGRTLAQTTAVSFTNTGRAWQPYAPAALGGGCDASGNVTLNFVRRTRRGGEWSDFVDVPLSETAEKYIVQIWDSTYTLCARIIEVTTQTASYTSAQQVSDFVAQQQTIYFSVGQVGAYVFGSQAYGTAKGAGGSNGLPTVPITPYVMNPIVAPPPPGGGSRPVNHVFTQPAEILDLSLTVGQVWVGQFTTGASLPTAGHIRAFEFSGPQLQRSALIATDTGGLNVVASNFGSSTEIVIGGTYGVVLLPSTTYYWINDFQLGDGGYPAAIGSAAGTRIDFGGIPS